MLAHHPWPQRAESAGVNSPICAAFYGGLGQVYYEWRQPEKAHLYFQRAIQLSALVVFSILAILFRVQNPLGIKAGEWYHPVASSIVLPHNFAGMLFQSTIAILILVGFESSTALAAEAKDPRRDIPRGVILSLVIQGLFAYLLEYFAANYALSDRLVSADSALKGIAAAAASEMMAPPNVSSALFEDLSK